MRDLYGFGKQAAEVLYNNKGTDRIIKIFLYNDVCDETETPKFVIPDLEAAKELKNVLETIIAEEERVK